MAPVVLFVYNRPMHTEQTLEALHQNELADESILYIYADGPKGNLTKDAIEKIIRTRRVIRKKKWCKEVHIIESTHNKGLADSIISGVTDTVNRYGKAIVLEDDVVTSKGFLRYMNDALVMYEHDAGAMHISGFIPYTRGAAALPETFFSGSWLAGDGPPGKIPGRSLLWMRNTCTRLSKDEKIFLLSIWRGPLITPNN